MPHHKAQECDATETTGTVIDSSHVTEHCGVNWLTQNSQALVAHLLYAGVCQLSQQATQQSRLGNDDAKRNQTFDCVSTGNKTTAVTLLQYSVRPLCMITISQ